MPLTREAKHALRESLTERFAKANATVVTHYRGLTVAEVSELRSKMRENGAEFKVVKNRIAKIAISEGHPGSEPISKHLEGPVGIVYVYGDAGQATKALLEFKKIHKEKFDVLAGLMDGHELDAGRLTQIADLPSKEVLLAQIVGSLVAPHRGLLTVLSGVARQLVQVINAIKESKE